MSAKGHGYWERLVPERHFKTGIDLQLLSWIHIKQNSEGFIACPLHVLCVDCRITMLSAFLACLWALFTLKSQTVYKAAASSVYCIVLHRHAGHLFICTSQNEEIELSGNAKLTKTPSDDGLSYQSLVRPVQYSAHKHPRSGDSDA